MGIWTSTVTSNNKIYPRRFFNQYAIRELNNSITLAQPIASGDETIIVSAGHGFTVGEHVNLWASDKIGQFEVVAINVDGNANKIKVESPILQAYTVAETKVTRADTRLNLNGSVTPVDFNIRMQEFIYPIDLHGVIFHMQHGNKVADDGRFGGLTALTNGVYFRRLGDVFNDFLNNRTNLDFKAHGFNVTYTTSAPSGVNSTECYLNFQDKFRTPIQINTGDGAYIAGTVRDDLSAIAGMTFFKAIFVGVIGNAVFSNG